MRFIEELSAAYPVRLLCKVANVSVSGFYAWRDRSPSQREARNAELLAATRAIHVASRGTYGRPRLRRALLADGWQCSSERLRRIMVKHGITSKHRRKYRATTNSRHNMPVAENLVQRRFVADAPNRLWVADTTFIATQEGWLYLAAILDVFSRVIVGWSMSNANDRHLVVRALDMGIQRRQVFNGLVHHSDRGSTYASADYQKTLKGKGVVCSMSRKGDCWDNGMMESFFHTLKAELIRDEKFTTRAAAANAVFEYIEVFYNKQRLHSSLEFTAPLEYERNRRS
jgi:putative transposase